MEKNEKVLGLEPLIGESVSMKNTVLGKYVEVGMYNFLENVDMDDYSYTGQFCFVQNADIGKFSNIAAMVRIGPTDHPYERPSLHHFTYRQKMYGFAEEDDNDFFGYRASRKTQIGHDTWIGHGAIISPDVTVGNGAVIGAGAIVTKDVEPYSIIVGVPGKEIKKRFTDDIIKAMEETQWWNWPHEKIKEHISDFHLPAEEFVSKHR